MRINPKASFKGKHGAVRITSQALEIDIDPVKLAADAAEAGASAVAADIAALPGDSWHKTGTLARGIAVQRSGMGSAVVAPPDRLQRPGLLEKLVEQLAVLRDPASDKRIEKAIDASATTIVKVVR